MANNKKKGFGLYVIDLDVMSKVLWIVVMALGVIATAFIFGPALVTSIEEIHTGTQVTFGELWFDAVYVKQYIPFTFWAFVGYFFPLFASILMAFNYEKENKWFDIGCAAMFLVSVILIVLLSKYVYFVKDNTITDTISKTLVDDTAKLGWGAQLTIFASFLGIITSLLKWFSDTYNKEK